MLQAGPMIPDLVPWIPVFGGILSALITVVLASWISRQSSQVKALRSIKSEIEYNAKITRDLITRIINEIEGSHLEEEVELPMGTELEITYIMALPGPLSTSSFEYMRQTGRFAHLSIDIRDRIFRHYNRVEKINHLLSHRDEFHFEKIENIYLEIRQHESSTLKEGKIHESDLPEGDQEKIQNIRELRRVMKRIDESILTQIGPLLTEETRNNLSTEQKTQINLRDTDEQLAFTELTNYLGEKISNKFMSRLV